MESRNEIVFFETKDKAICLTVPIEKETVWLTQDQMSELFDTARSSIAYHIGKIFKEGELQRDTSVEIFDRSKNMASRPPQYYNLDVIISVGYRVKSQRGIDFRQWANSVLKQYIIKGYAVNEKRLQALEKTVSIQTKMLADALDVEAADVLRAINKYTEALTLLDQYDHQEVTKPDGSLPIYRLTYDDCKTMVDVMSSAFNTDVFGVEKERGKVKGIIEAVYQSAFGEDAYPSIEEKAANLLYFMIKDHPYADGCKRIAASLFLEFLERNEYLYRNGSKIISDGALVAITLMIAESNPEEKEIMTSLVMNMLKMN